MIVFPSPDSSIAFNLFNIPIKYYGLLMTTAIFVGLLGSYILFLKKYGKKFADSFLDDSFLIILSAVFGARIFYILANYKFYFNNPIEMLMINHGGISIWGAIIFSIITIILISKKKKINPMKYMDVLACVMPLSQAIGRWGNYFNQEAFGSPTTGFMKLFVDEQFRPLIYKNISYFHPAFFYESILNLILFIILISLLKFKKLKLGLLTCLYLIGYSLIRIIVESIRIDSNFNPFNIPIAQIISFVVLTISFIILVKISISDKKNGEI